MNKDNKKFVVETLFLKETLKHKLSLNEFIVLMYFDNEPDVSFDVKKVSKATCLSENDVLMAFGTLLDKKLISIMTEKNESGKMVDRVSLDNLYNSIKSTNKPKEKKVEDTLFTKFQKKYSKSLSSMDYELINGWLTCGYSEDLILGALDEANYNGKSSLSYIDKILYNWSSKGFKNMDDVNDHLINRKSQKNKEQQLYESEVLEYNWLDEE